MIDIHDLCKVYLVGDERVRALDHATLHIYPKEFVSIIGCLDVADAGTYRLDNLPIESYTENQLAQMPIPSPTCRICPRSAPPKRT